jgi:hypothetical protein
MTVIAHHAGEHLILSAAVGSGLLSGWLLFLRAGIAQFARRRRRRHQ